VCVMVCGGCCPTISGEGLFCVRSMCVSWRILGVNIQGVNWIMGRGFSAYSMCVSCCVALGVRLDFFCFCLHMPDPVFRGKCNI